MSASAEEAPVDLIANHYEPFSPYERLVYEWKNAGSAPAFVLTRWHVDGFGAESELRLVSAERMAQVAPALEVCAAAEPYDGDMPDAVGSEPWAVVEWESGHSSGRVLLRGADLSGSGAACLEAVRAPVHEAVGPQPYAMPFWVDGEYGTLRTDASLAARLYVDGRPTGLITPVRGLRLEPGRHLVRWVAVATGAAREIEVQIEPGVTTSLDLEL